MILLKENSMAENLKGRTVSGIIWSSIQKFGTMGISFISNMVLARLLTPDDYGCIGMLMVFIAIANTFVDGGFDSALIQKKEPTDSDYSTIFYWNMLVSTGLYFLLFITSPIIASYYRIPQLSIVLRVQASILIINSIGLIQNNQLRKRLEFNKIAKINITASLISVIIAIIMGIMGFGLWALVFQQIIMSLATTILLCIVNRWVPKLQFSKQSFKELFNFGFFILLSNLINNVCNNVQGLLIGRIYTPATMGYYSQARKLSDLSSTSISSVIDQVSYPVLATAQNDIDALRIIIKRFISSLAFVTIPLMVCLILVAEPVITIVYSTKWIECVPYFKILCIAGIAISMQGINYYAVAAIGKSASLLVWTIIKRLIGLFFVVGGTFVFGMQGLLYGTVLGCYTLYIINSILASRYIGYSLWKQLADLVPIVVVSIIPYITCLLVNNILGSINMYVLAIFDLTIYIMLYLLISKSFHLAAYEYCKEVILNIIHKHFEKK